MKSQVIGFTARVCCPLCYSKVVGDHASFDGIRIAACAKCGFMFARDIRPIAAMQEQYVLGYEERRQLEGQTVNATVNRVVLEGFVTDYRGKSLLDVGSGYGVLLYQLRNTKLCRTVGIELSNAGREYSARELGIETYRQIDDIDKGDKFDIITLFELIEHIPEPREFLASVCERLKPGGSLIIGTDNFESDVVKVLGKQFPKWIPHEHISCFSPKSLEMLVDMLDGLTVVGVRSFTPWELFARKILFECTGGWKGGRRFNLQADTEVKTRRVYRCFGIRLFFNSLWFKLVSHEDLEGEMMYVHAIKKMVAAEKCSVI